MEQDKLTVPIARVRQIDALPSDYPISVYVRYSPEGIRKLRKLRSTREFKFRNVQYGDTQYIACTYWKAGQAKREKFYRAEEAKKLRNNVKVSRLLYSESGEQIGAIHNFALIVQK